MSPRRGAAERDASGMRKRLAILTSALATLAVLVGAPSAFAQSCLPPPCNCDQPPPSDQPPPDPGPPSDFQPPPDMGPPPPSFSPFAAAGLSDETVTEATPPPDAKFKIDIGGPADSSRTITYRTVDGTAKAGEDYVATSGEVKIDMCESKASFTVPILDDAMDEPDETFSVELGGDESGTATGTIVDDDAPPTLSVGSPPVVEGSTAQFPVTLSAPSAFTVTASYTTVSQTASAGSDFQPESGTVTFPPGTTAQTISVPVIADGANEGDETFGLAITAPQGATVGPPHRGAAGRAGGPAAGRRDDKPQPRARRRRAGPEPARAARHPAAAAADRHRPAGARGLAARAAQRRGRVDGELPGRRAELLGHRDRHDAAPGHRSARLDRQEAQAQAQAGEPRDDELPARRRAVQEGPRAHQQARPQARAAPAQPARQGDVQDEGQLRQQVNADAELHAPRGRLPAQLSPTRPHGRAASRPVP